MIKLEVLRGNGITAYLDDLARLRIRVFRDYPYLYDGSEAYERNYLRTYAESPRSIFVLAIDSGTVVGVATAIPLIDETDAIRAAFANFELPVEDVFYFGESVLLPSHRGSGIGHRFFDAREECASANGLTTTAFCSVLREQDDPRRPSHYYSNDAFWRKRGYRQRPELRCRMTWREVGDSDESSHELVFWTRTREGTS